MADRALILVADTDDAVDVAALCAAYCERRGYILAGVVTGVGPEEWARVVDLVVVQRAASVVVVPSMSILMSDRHARVESVTQESLPAVEGGGPDGRWRRRLRRPRFIR